VAPWTLQSNWRKKLQGFVGVTHPIDIERALKNDDGKDAHKQGACSCPKMD
jgi:hypothetical protein